MTMGVSYTRGERRGHFDLLGEVASVELMLVETGSTGGRVLTLVCSLLEVDDRTGLKVDGDGISVVRVRSAKDSVGLLVVVVSGRVSERDIGLVYNVVGGSGTVGDTCCFSGSLSGSQWAWRGSGCL